MSRYAGLALVPFFILCAAAPARGESTPKPAETPHAEADAPAPGLKSRVFEVKHRDPLALRSLLKTLGSGAKGSAVDVTPELRTIAVRDFPENLATMEEALTRLDRPGAAVPDVELAIHVLSTSRAAEPDDVPAELRDTVAALKSTLSYKSYRLLATFGQRVTNGTRGVRVGGVVGTDGTPPRDVQAELSVTQVGLIDAASSPATVRLDGLRFVMVGDGGGKAEIATDVSVKEGERVVVGTSTYRGRGVVLVVSARVLR
jgi:hypothetical protein